MIEFIIFVTYIQYYIYLFLYHGRKPIDMDDTQFNMYNSKLVINYMLNNNRSIDEFRGPIKYFRVLKRSELENN